MSHFPKLAKPFLFLRVVSRVRALQRADRRPPAETLAARGVSLAALREFAVRTSPFYADLHRGLENAPLDQLPPVTKALMMENLERVVTDRRVRLAEVERYLESLPAQALYLDRYRVCSTSGSTGRRGFFLFDPEEWVTELASFRRAAGWSGIRHPLLTGRIAAVTSPVPWHMSAQLGASIHLPWMQMARLQPGDPPEVMVARLNAAQPDLLSVYPSIGRILAREQLDGRLHIAPRALMTGSETLTPATRMLMERAWGECIFNHYGATETGSIAAECWRHRMHVVEDLLVVEGVDEENRPVPDGVPTAKLLVTVLFRRTQPLIRYEISDRVVFSAAGCDCGLPWRVMERVVGRGEEVLHLPAAAGGRVMVHPVVFEKIFDNLPVSGWQVTSDGKSVTILVSGGKGVDLPAAGESLRAELLAQGVAPLPVAVSERPELARTRTGKTPRIRMV